MHTLNLHNAICQLYLNKAGAGNRIGRPSDSSKNNLKKIVSNIQITSWEIDGETVADFIFLGSKITADGDRSEIKKHLLLGRKVMTNLDAAAAKSLQSCPTLCDPIDGSPPGSPIPEILQARTLEWVAISFSNA